MGKLYAYLGVGPFRLAQNFISNGDEKDMDKALKRAETVHFAGGKYSQEPDGSRKYADGYRIGKQTWILHDSVVQYLKAAGITEQGYTEWGPDEQLQSRPVMFHWEIVDADAKNCLIIVPGRYNAQLKRFAYYSDPVFSKWARHNPHKPTPVIVNDNAPAPPPGAKFDPATGRPLTAAAAAGSSAPQPVAPRPKFDTNTGLPIP